MQHVNYRIEGIVQGVGFRPFVYKLAVRYGLLGYVLNDSLGVEISLEGTNESLRNFTQALHVELPPLARIDALVQTELPLQNFKDFIIKESQSLASKHSLVSPDFAMCDACLTEMRDPNNKRYNYFFTNCTDCGPRYSIVRTVPYDRPNTAMATFLMCEDCAREYSDPLDRRYHAQPISCIACGPTLSLKSIDGSILAHNDDAIIELAEQIKMGAIVALKGMGGFHLICDALNEETIGRLREKKNRPSKPFAVMMRDIQQVRQYSDADTSELDAICSMHRPIVLVKSKKNISSLIAPHIDRIGIFLPYTPLHVRLFDYLENPIIATSANLSGEPIITSETQLCEKLCGVVEFYLDYDREIVNASDDSVLQIIDEKKLLMRSSRGFTPTSMRIHSVQTKKILAVGAHQKNAIALYMNEQVIQSPYIGDLQSVAAFEFFEKTLETFKRFYDFSPDLIVCDKHPRYASTLWAKEQNLPLVFVQHHYAHVLSCMFEYGIDERVLGIAWDGTGYGDDGSIWGGEFFLCDRLKYERVAYFEPFLLLGGEASIKDIRRIALSMIFDCETDSIYEPFLATFSKAERELLEQVHRKKLNTPKCSAVGRLFDAVAVLCGVCERVSYDGESGLILESLYDANIVEAYDFYLDGKVIRYKHTIAAMLRDKEPRVIATKFINALANIAVQIAKSYDYKTLLSGGVFQNRTLLEAILRQKADVIFQNKLPINDGGIAVGQLAHVLAYH